MGFSSTHNYNEYKTVDAHDISSTPGAEIADNSPCQQSFHRKVVIAIKFNR